MEDQQLSRRLSAILAADIVGYSRLMAQDEAGTLAALNQHRSMGFDPFVARHNGRIVKLMGDGTLVEFGSVVDAVQCAREIQETAAGASGQIVLRIGINLGDIILQGDDIFGDGVNIASRLEPLAQPGGICISSVVNENVAARVDMAFHDGGEVQVKNIDRPLRVYHWHPDLTAGEAPAPAVETKSERPSVAVLPFDNMSGDPEQEFFSDGISEDIITDLSKVPGLAVIARNSSFAYRGQAVDLRRVGRELGVTSVLEGSVRRAGQRVRITAQLIDASNGEHLWADRFDRDLTDIFAVQDEVTLEIVNALKIRLTPADRDQITAVGTTSLEAHEEYMRMRGFLFFPGMDAAVWRHAVAAGERAIALDPRYAEAYSILAMMQMLDYHNGWSGDPSEAALARAQQCCGTALELDPDGRWPNHCSAVVARWTGDLERSEALMNRAMSRSDEYALGLFTRGEITLGKGQFTQAVADLEGAIRLDPAFRHQYLQFLAMAHFLMGHYETAALLLRERVFLVRETDIGRGWLAAALGHLGQVDEAQEIWAELMQVNPAFDLRKRLARLNMADPGCLDDVIAGIDKAGLIERI